ncbi:MAG: translation initiation factor IF-5A [Candidatus Aenigmarchaeota archaeon]|nr:translation initiation factor IF-5A [Candidatus Aenigmarchaeota archaeon]
MEEKKQTEIKNLKSGSFVLLDDDPCRVDKIQISKPGKHGGAKARITATGVFSGTKKNLVKPGDTRVDVPIIEKRSVQVLAIIGNVIQLMDLEDYSNFETEKPEDIELHEGQEVTIWRYGSRVMIK